MDKIEKQQYFLSHEDEIKDIIELIGLYRKDGYNRLRIWAEFRSNGTNPDLILEAFKRTHLV